MLQINKQKSVSRTMLDQKYLEQFSDYHLEKAILLEENIPVLEELLAQEIQTLRELQKAHHKGKLDFGTIPEEKELEHVFHDAKSVVDKLLETPQPILGNVTYDKTLPHEGVYRPRSRNIVVQPYKRAILIPILVHEYTHCVQHFAGIPLTMQSLLEGHARGVEKLIASEYAEKENNQAFLYWTFNRIVDELRKLYKHLCKTFRKEPQQKIFEIKTFYDPLGLWGKIKAGWGALINHDEYPLGTAFVTLHEHAFGKDIYRDILHGKYDLEKRTKEMRGKQTPTA